MDGLLPSEAAARTPTLRYCMVLAPPYVPAHSQDIVRLICHALELITAYTVYLIYNDDVFVRCVSCRNIMRFESRIDAS